MTAKEKAIELYEKFYFAPDQDGFHSQNKYRAKTQALICVEEIMKLYYHLTTDYQFWSEVKKELEDFYPLT